MSPMHVLSGQRKAVVQVPRLPDGCRQGRIGAVYCVHQDLCGASRCLGSQLGKMPSHHALQQQCRFLTSSRRLTILAAVPTEGFTGFAYFMRPEVATIFSALVAVCSVGLNLWGGMLMEQRRAELKQQMEHESSFMHQQRELASILARYRGPMLESIVDLEQRVYHLISQTNEWCAGSLVVEEEVVYTLYTMAQFLGYLEVVRREGPRERSFLQKGNPQGSDTLAAWVEAIRFVLAAHPALLQDWYNQSHPTRAHPGQRRRSNYQITEQDPAEAHEAFLSSLSGRRVRTASGANNGSTDGVALGSNGAADIQADGSSMSSAEAAVTGAADVGEGANAATAAHAASTAAAISGSVKTRSWPHTGWSASLVTVDREGAPTGGGRGWDLLGGAPNWAAAPVEGILVPGVDSRVGEPRKGAMKGSGQNGSQGVAPMPYTLQPGDQERFAALSCNFRMSRGTQRAVGSSMIITPAGADRHYTMGYGDFYRRLRSEPYFAGWMRPLYEDVMRLVASNRAWQGQAAFPVHTHTRLLLMQQLLIDAMDFLDPTYIRVPAIRRVRLCPVQYDDLTNVGVYKEKLAELELIFATSFERQGIAGGSSSAGNATSGSAKGSQPPDSSARTAWDGDLDDEASSSNERLERPYSSTMGKKTSYH